MANNLDDMVKNVGSKKWIRAFDEGFRLGLAGSDKLPSPAYREPHACAPVWRNGYMQGVAEREESDKSRSKKRV